jgi:hypothetical protein
MVSRGGRPHRPVRRGEGDPASAGYILIQLHPARPLVYVNFLGDDTELILVFSRYRDGARHKVSCLDYAGGIGRSGRSGAALA